MLWFWNSLPVELIRLIFEYLTTNELCKVDNSIQNHEIRSKYLDAIKGLVLQDIFDDYPTGLHEWLILRHVYVDQLIFLTINIHCIKFLHYSQQVLRSLDFSYCDGVDDKVIIGIGSCPVLTRVLLSGCQFLTDLGMIPFITQNPQIEILDINEVPLLTERSISALTIYCRNFYQIDVSHDSWFTDECLFLLIHSFEERTISLSRIHSITSQFESLMINFVNCNVSHKMYHFFLETVVLPKLLSSNPKYVTYSLQCLTHAIHDVSF